MLRVFWGISLVFLLTSCSYFFGEEDANNAKNYHNLALDNNADGSMNCIKNNTQLLQDYFNMERSDATIAKDMLDMKVCLTDAVMLFVDYTQGQSKTEYTPEELHNFLVDTFGEYNYGIDFMEDVFRVKESLLGGKTRAVSKAEIKDFLKYIDFIYTKLAEHAPDRRLLFSDKSSENKKEDREQFLKVSPIFLKNLEGFRNLPRKTDGQFDYSALTSLITHLMADEDKADWKKTFQLVNSIQSLVASGQPDKIDSGKLPFVIDNLGMLFMGYMEFQKFLKDDIFYNDLSTVFTFPGLLNKAIKNPEVFNGDRPKILNHIQRTILTPLKNAIANTPDQSISIGYVNALLDTFDKLDYLPSYASAYTLKAMVPQFFGRWAAAGSCGNSCEAKVVKAENIDVLLDLMDDWRERQDWVNQQSRSQKGQEPIEISKADRAKTLNLKNFRDSMIKMKYVHWEDYVVIGQGQMNYKDTVLFNNIYTLILIFTRPYNDNMNLKDVNDYFMDQQQTEDLFTWIRDLGIELKIADPRSNDGGTAFIEINLFGSSSYNPEQLNFIEMLEYLEINLSTGLRSVYMMENEFLACRTSILDVFDYQKLDALCTRESLKQNVDRLLFTSLPGLKAYLQKAPADSFDRVMEYLEKAARQGTLADDPMDTETFRLTSSISQYAESLFLRFDVNGDNIVDSEEIQPTMAHIVPGIHYLIEHSMVNGPNDVDGKAKFDQLYGVLPNFERDVVTYILRNKELPDVLKAETPGGQYWGVGNIWVSNTSNWVFGNQDWLASDEVHATREDFMLVISALSYFQRVQKVKKIKDIFWHNKDKFDQGITNIEDKVFDDLMAAVKCSVKIKKETRQWLFDKQSDYWVRAEADEILNLFGWSITGSSIPGHELLSNWSDAVTLKFVDLLYKDPQFGPLCSLPYMQGVQTLRGD